MLNILNSRWIRRSIFVGLTLMSALVLGATSVVRVDGSIFNAAGAPITGNRDLQIRAYTASTAGTLLWTSSVYTAAISEGRFSINLDASTGSPSLVQRLSAAASSDQIWFEIDCDTGAADGSMNTPITAGSRIRARGSLFALAAAKADSLTGVSATTAELNYVSGVTSNLQSQINALTTSGLSTLGGTMTGGLGLNYAGVNAGGAAYVDSTNRTIQSLSSVDSTELGYLDGVTANLQAQFSAVSGNYVAKTGSSMSGTLEVGAVIATSSSIRAGTDFDAQAVNGSYKIGGTVVISVNTGVGARSVAVGPNAAVTASSAVQLGSGTNSTANSLQFNGYNFLDSSGNATFNSINSTLSSTELGYLDGATASVQTQLNAKQASIPYTPANKGGDTLTGALATTLVSDTDNNIDFDLTNIAITTASCGSTTLNNLRSGGSYSLIFNTPGTGTCSFTDGGGRTVFTPTVPAAATNPMVFTFIVTSDKVFVSYIQY